MTGITHADLIYGNIDNEILRELERAYAVKKENIIIPNTHEQKYA